MHTEIIMSSYTPNGTKFWWGKTLVNLVNSKSFTNILPNQFIYFLQNPRLPDKKFACTYMHDHKYHR